jgi:hypothetical protein
MVAVLALLAQLMSGQLEAPPPVKLLPEWVAQASGNHLRRRRAAFLEVRK